MTELKEPALNGSHQKDHHFASKFDGVPANLTTTCPLSKTQDGVSRASSLPNGHHQLDSQGNLSDIQIPSTCLDEDKLEAIAIIGMALRGPQRAVTPEALWDMVVQGESSMTKVPSSRFSLDPSNNADSSQDQFDFGGGHFLEQDIASFDAPFFAVSTEEANCMDPQQRLLLEVTYEALENAGIPLQRSKGTKTSVHIGSFNQDYSTLLDRDPQTKAPHKTTGNAPALLSNRLSWHYDWSGPSITIDTACSSSLTALHLACQSLRNAESNMAVAGGCNVLINPSGTIALTELGFLSPDNECKSFDATANGYARGEGVGLVVLKRLKDAIRENDVIRAVVRATGLNQDARTQSLTQPNSKSQETLIKETYEAAGVSMRPTRFFESHGTGTVVGDPIEARAIHAAFKDELTDHELYVGAVKSNVGHLEGTSGIVGLMKTVLALEKGIIPPNRWPRDLNPEIPEEWQLRFLSQSIAWPVSGLRRASVNSFGFGGANAHCILDDAYHYLSSRNLRGNHNTTITKSSIERPNQQPELTNGTAKFDNAACNRPQLLIWSAPDEKALQRLTTAYQNAVERKKQSKAAFYHRLAYTLSERRSVFRWKSFLVCSEGDHQLNTADYQLSTPHRSLIDPSICFIFAGQGAQSPKMGLELRSYPVFAQAMDYADRFYTALGARWSLNDELSKPPASQRIDSAELSQPCCTALQLALVELLKDWGVSPKFVVGHSSGEIAAAFASGAISRDSALKIAYFRGIVAASTLQKSQKPQAMMSANVTEQGAKVYIERMAADGHYLTIACLNAPSNVTISGDASGIDLLKETLDKADIFCRKLKVEVAYHSRYMEDVAVMYNLLIGDINPGDTSSSTTMVSTVTARPVLASESCQPAYWCRNLVERVDFCGAIESLYSINQSSSVNNSNDKSTPIVDHFLEVGPHPVLRSAILEVVNRQVPLHTPRCSTVLRRGVPASVSALRAAGELYCTGTPISIKKVNQYSSDGKTACLVDLPRYPFDRSKLYWRESRINRDLRFPKSAHHELLGLPMEGWNSMEPCWRNAFDIKDVPWVADHEIDGAIVLPMTCIIALAIEMAHQHFSVKAGILAYRLKDLRVPKAIIIPRESGYVEWQTSLRPHTSSTNETTLWADFTMYVCENDAWVETCRGTVGIDRRLGRLTSGSCQKMTALTQKAFDKASASLTGETTTDNFYAHVRSLGCNYGPSFRGLRDVTFSSLSHTARATVDLRHWQKKITEPSNTMYTIHPAALDAILQCMLAASSFGGPKSHPPILPTQFNELWINAEIEGGDLWSEAKVHSNMEFEGIRGADFSLNVIDSKTEKPLLVGHLQTIFVQGQDSTNTENADLDLLDSCYHSMWEPDLDFLHQDNLKSVFKLKETDPDVVSQHSICECMASLACRKFQEMDVSPEALDSHPHLAQYSHWLRTAAQRHEEASLSHVCDKSLETLTAEAESGGIIGQLIARTVKALPQILRGEVSPVEYLFQDELINTYYAEAVYLKSGYANVVRYIDLLAHKNPALRILEIGAGTGGCTAPVLETLTQNRSNGQSLPRFSEYMFTDISSGFFEQAQQKFERPNHNVQFATLNIEKDPELQGISLESYDLVIASNVIHATASISNSLKNTRKLLKPRGQLLLYEGVHPELLATGFVFGLLSGWWLSSESYRTLGPLLTEERWDEELQKEGFSNAFMKLRDFGDQTIHLSTVMISRAEQIILDMAPSNPRIVIAIQETSTQHEIAKSLKSTLDTQTKFLCDIVPIDQLKVNLSSNSDEVHTIFVAAFGSDFLLEMDSGELEALKNVIARSKMIVWPAIPSSGHCGPPASTMALGLLRSVQTEHEGLQATMITLDASSSTASVTDAIARCYGAMLVSPEKDVEGLYEQRQGVVGISRLKEAQTLNKSLVKLLRPQQPHETTLGDGSRPMKLTVGNPGLLDTLHFIDDQSAMTPLAEDELEVKVVCAGLNFLDLLTALGGLNQEFSGIEAAGTVTQSGRNTQYQPGDRVVCVGPGCFRHYARCKVGQVVSLPEGVDFASAAALPVVYCTAYYSLVTRANIQPGETVLIHSAAGGLGQALVQIAQLYGAEIFATVSSDSKREFLSRRYGIPSNHIFSSKNCNFADQVQLATDGRGVDVVVNSLSGEKLSASWDCVAPFGRFIEVGKKDIETLQLLPLKGFAKNVSFIGVDFLHLALHDHMMCSRLLKTVVDLFSEDKITVPESLRVYNASQIEEAFRLMQSGKATGKAVFKFQPEDRIMSVIDPSARYRFKADATYLIAGGLGGLGRSAARWMVQRGARHLIILSRRKPASYTSDVTAFIQELKEADVEMALPSCDVSNHDELKTVLSTYTDTMPPIRGCLQASMVLRDVAFQNMSHSDFQTVIRPKVHGSWNLHCLLPEDLDFFILLSSISGIAGNMGQSNYNAGNSFQDGLARYRVKRGQKAVSIDLGAVKKVGYVAERKGTAYDNRILDDLIGMSDVTFHALLDIYCNPDVVLPDEAVAQVICGLNISAVVEAKQTSDFYSSFDWPLFSYLKQIGNTKGATSTVAVDVTDWSSQLKQAGSTEDAQTIICNALVQKLSKAIGIDVQDIDTTYPLNAYGIDSLGAVELRKWFKGVCSADVTTFEILSSDGIAMLSQNVASRMMN